MNKMTQAALAAAAMTLAPMSLWAATPASGELTDVAPALEWTGGGPYVFTNVTPLNGADTVVCDPTVPPLCDEFALTVNIPDEFRELEENQRESVRIGIEFPVTAGAEDYDLYFLDGAGNVMGESATGGQESITVPLKTLKNGSYTVRVIPFAPMGTNYNGVVQIGKVAKAATKGFTISPQVTTALTTVSFDASGLSATAPAGGYAFNFGDGSAPVTDADGKLEYAYAADGQYLARVSYADDQGLKGLQGAAQPVFVGELPAAGKSGGQFGGALGFAALLGLLGLAGLRRR